MLFLGGQPVAVVPRRSWLLWWRLVTASLLLLLEVESAIAVYPAHKIEVWHCLNAEDKSRLKKLKQQATFQVGDRVTWCDCPGSLEMFNPFTIRKVEGVRSGWIGSDTQYTARS
jgi:hypothetical protein